MQWHNRRRSWRTNLWRCVLLPKSEILFPSSPRSLPRQIQRTLCHCHGPPHSSFCQLPGKELGLRSGFWTPPNGWWRVSLIVKNKDNKIYIYIRGKKEGVIFYFYKPHFYFYEPQSLLFSGIYRKKNEGQPEYFVSPPKPRYCQDWWFWSWFCIIFLIFFVINFCNWKCEFGSFVLHRPSLISSTRIVLFLINNPFFGFGNLLRRYGLSLVKIIVSLLSFSRVLKCFAYYICLLFGVLLFRTEIFMWRQKQ
jgi:hypothetical protein